MKNDAKIILDLCGGTGSWSKPYADAGYTVHNLTMPEFDVTRAELQQNNGVYNLVFPRKSTMLNLVVPVASVHGILAAPPCTQFSFARQRYKKPANWAEAMRPVEACLQIVWHCQKFGKLKWWALENPTGHLRKFLGRPEFRFCQWQYGGTFVKPTDIWGYFTNPSPTVRRKPKTLSDTRMAKWANPKIPDHLRHLPTVGERRAAVRAITPPGFARAFKKANP